MRVPHRIFRLCGLVVLAGAGLTAQPSDAAAADAPELDYLFFREQVQPIFLAKRSGHARCVTCHTHRSPPLQELSPGAETWDNEQSRKNFEAWKLYVTPGKPLASRFLLHPLAHEAGGDAFHAGGKHWSSQAHPEWQTLAAWVRGQRQGGVAIGTASGGERLLQSNAAGDNIHVIDPATDQIVGLIAGIESPHGVAISPDGKRIYASNEALNTLDVVDVRTLAVFKRIPLSGRPNNIDVGVHGAKVYVGIRQEPGAVDVIDAVALTFDKSIPVHGPIHNVYVTPDGAHLFAGSIESKTLSVVDLERESVVWTVKPGAGVRPMVITKRGDGSTGKVYMQLSDFHGFAVVDFATRREVERIEFPEQPGLHKETDTLQGSPAHGLALSPDQRVLWSTSKYYGAVYAYGVPADCRPDRPWPEGRSCEWEVLKVIEVGRHPDWLAMTEDGKKLYVALAGEDATAVVDTETMELVGKIAVGNVPKRNTVGLLTR